jgi:hypothetical protein
VYLVGFYYKNLHVCRLNKTQRDALLFKIIKSFITIYSALHVSDTPCPSSGALLFLHLQPLVTLWVVLVVFSSTVMLLLAVLLVSVGVYFWVLFNLWMTMHGTMNVKITRLCFVSLIILVQENKSASPHISVSSILLFLPHSSFQISPPALCLRTPAAMCISPFWEMACNVPVSSCRHFLAMGRSDIFRANWPYEVEFRKTYLRRLAMIGDQLEQDKVSRFRPWENDLLLRHVINSVINYCHIEIIMPAADMSAGKTQCELGHNNYCVMNDWRIMCRRCRVLECAVDGI